MNNYSKTIGIITQKIRNHQCNLFVGAGLSIVAGMPATKDLAEKLKEEIFVADDIEISMEEVGKDLELITEYYAQKYEQFEAHKKVARIIQDVQRNANTYIYEKLCQLPFNNIITTNYDELIEKALPDLTPDRIIRQDDQATTMSSPKKPILIKMHGDISHPQKMILTKTDILEYTSNNPNLVTLIQNVLKEGSMLFLGFSKQANSFIEAARSYLNVQPAGMVPHIWYVVDNQKTYQELFRLKREKTEIIEMDLNEFLKVLFESYESGRVAVKKVWTILEALQYIHVNLKNLNKKYKLVVETIDEYQDPSKRYISAITKNADLTMLMYERDKLKYAVDLMNEEKDTIMQKRGLKNSLLQQAEEFYKPVHNRMKRSVNESVFSELMPGNKDQLDIAQLQNQDDFKKESKYIVKFFYPPYGNAPEDIIAGYEEKYSKMVDLRNKNRQAEFYSLYFFKKYEKLNEIYPPNEAEPVFQEIQRVVPLKSEEELFKDCETIEITLIAMEELAQYTAPIRSTFQSMGIDFGHAGTTGDAFISMMDENISEVTAEIKQLKNDLENSD